MNRKKKKETVIAVMVIIILFFVILLGGIRYRILGSSTKDVVEELDSEEQQEAGTDTISHSVEDNNVTKRNVTENHASENRVIENNVVENNVIENEAIDNNVTDNNKEAKLLYSFTSEQMQQEVEKLVENYYTNLGKEELYSYTDIAGQLQLATGDIENLKTLLAAGSTEYDSDKASLDALIHALSDRIAGVEGSRASNGDLWELKEELNQLSTVLNNYMITVDESLNGITLYVEEGDLFGSWTDEEGNLISKKLDFAQ